MSEIGDLLNEMSDLLNDAFVDEDKLGGGNKAAGYRLRKNALGIQKLTKPIRILAMEEIKRLKESK